MAKYKLNDIIIRANTKVDKDTTNLIYYVGGEHFTSGDVVVDQRGLIEGSTIGPMFYYGFTAGQFLLVSRNPHLKKAGVVDFDGICSEKTFVLETADPSVLSPRFLPFVLQNDRFWEYAVANRHGSTNFFINWATLSAYEFDLPSIEEQEKLADILWALVATKKKYAKLLQKTDELVKSQFIEMFGDEAKQVRLDELCLHFGDGDWIESKDQSEEGIRLIQTGNVGNGEYKDKDDKARYISEETFARLGCTEVFPGDILISRLPDPIGRACIVPEMPKSITAVDCTIVRLKDEILSTFFVNFTKTPMYTMQIDSFTTGSTRKRISRANLGSIMVPVPDLARQERFALSAEQSDISKFELTQAISRIDDMIKSLMQG